MPVLEAVDNIGIVVSNVLKTQSKLEGLKAKLSDVGTPESKELLVQSSDWQWLYMIYIYIYIYILIIYIYIYQSLWICCGVYVYVHWYTFQSSRSCFTSKLQYMFCMTAYTSNLL